MLSDENFILIEEGDGGFEIIGVDHVDPDLGVVELGPDMLPQWHVRAMVLLQDRLAGSSLAQHFIPS